MNRYPLWKYLLVLVVFILGLVYTLPNFYGESPAVQVLPLRANLKADSVLLQRVDDTLKAGNLNAEGVALDPTSVKVRFNSADSQLKAKDILQAKLGDDYMVALNLQSRSPQWLTALNARPMYLGLDLRGGVHFLLQIDMKGALDKAMEAASGDMRGILREQNIVYSGVSRDGRLVTVMYDPSSPSWRIGHAGRTHSACSAAVHSCFLCIPDHEDTPAFPTAELFSG